MPDPGHGTPQPDNRVPARDRRPSAGPQDRAGRACRWGRVRARDHPGQEADRRRDRADAGLQRLGAGTDPQDPPGCDGHRARHQPRRPRGNRPLARPTTREPLRRHPRHAGPDPGRREVHVPAARARPRRLLVPPPHPRGLWPGTGPVRKILATPSEPDYWPPANRELLLTLDDILIEDGQIATFRQEETTHVAMGRFGNVMLVAGEPDLPSKRKRGEVVRLYLTNTANTRVFNVTMPGAQMKLVGADSGHYEHEELVDEVLSRRPNASSSTSTSPSRGARPRARTPERTYRLASITVATTQPTQTSRWVRYPADERRHDRLASASGPTSLRRPTRHSRSSPRWRWAPEGPVVTRARCIPRWSARSRASVRSAG